MTTETHTIMDGKVTLYKRDESRYWQCSTFMDGRNHRMSTKEDTLTMAKEFAYEWYMTTYVQSKATFRNKRTARLLESFGRSPAPQYPALGQPEQPKLPAVTTFKEVAKKFLEEYTVLTQGERSEEWTWQHKMRIEVHLNPFFGDKPVNQINAGLVQEYRVDRQTKGHKGRKPSRSTLHHETVTLRLVLKTAMRHHWIQQVPDISSPYKTSGKVKHRAWFSKEEYKLLTDETRKRSENPSSDKYNNQHNKNLWQNLHDYVLFMANTGLRPDEAARLEYRDVTEVMDEDTGERILEIEVRGKRGVGHCKSMNGAVFPFNRHKKRNKGQPTDLIFGKTPRMEFNKVLDHLNLKYDRDKNVRSAYSLRHTYICLRLLDGAEIYDLAKNCRTSVEMIQDHYAVHLKNSINAAAVNVRKPRKRGKKSDNKEPN
jgi:integrase